MACSSFNEIKVMIKTEFMLRHYIAGLVIMFVFFGCKKSEPSTSSCSVGNYDPCSLKAPASEIQAVKDYLAANNITATEHCSGLFYAIDAPGTGVTPTLCSIVTVTYEGKLTNGTVFDSNATGAAFLLADLIEGWKVGIPLIKAGGSIRLYVPPTLGYGPNNYGTIPGNSILVFRVDLKAVR